ncbi:uncharacterized protein V6R79_024345 [Siganus canaliculatus]
MEPPVADGPSLAAALLASAVRLDAAPAVGEHMLELYRLQAALLRRRRLREAAERDRRRRQYQRRRRAFLLSSLAAVLSLITTTSRHIWVRDRGSGRNFWAAAECFDDEQWKSQFRVSRSTFDFLMERIGPAIKRRRTNYRVPIEPRRRLAIALWWFARSGEYRSIAGLFGVGIATVCNIVRQVTAAILERLYRRHVSLPGGRRLEDAVGAFRDRCYPHFTDVYAGWPGGTSSAAVLSSSDLYLKAEDRPDGYLFPREKSVVLDGVEVPVHLIGDASFPLKPWLMKAYSLDCPLTPEQRRFTYALSSARSVVDAAFTRLKGRWRCLLKKSDINVSTMARIVAACCVLHNICEERGDGFLPEWDGELLPSAAALRQPDTEPYAGDTYCTAEVIRDAISCHLPGLLQR